MKESLGHIDSRIVFRDTFQSEQNTRRLGGVPTDVDYSQGIGEFDGSSTLLFDKVLNGTYSIRIKFKSLVPQTSKYMFSTQLGGGNGTGYIIMNSTTLLIAPSGVDYVDGLPTSNYSEDSKEVIISGITLVGDKLVIGSAYDLGGKITADYELIEIYKGILTAEEVSNLYNNRTYHELPDVIDEDTYKILDVAAFGGVLENKFSDGVTVPYLVPTDIEIKKVGSNMWSPLLNGTSSKIDAGNYDDLTGDKTFLIWAKYFGWGEAGSGRFIDNGKLRVITQNGQVRVSSNASTNADSAVSAVSLNKYQFIVVTRTSAGVTNIYIATKDTVPVLSGSANQDSGTPEAGTTNIILGNNNAGTTTFDGLKPRDQIYTGILSLAQMTQEWSNTRKDYNV